MAIVTNSPFPIFHPAQNFNPSQLSLEDFQNAFPDEGDYVEWKESMAREPLQRAIVAFSNANGGVVLIGVNDRGHPVGCPFGEGVKRDLWEIVNGINSPGLVKLHGFHVDRIAVTVVSVERRRQGIAQTSGGIPLVRKSKQNLPLVGEQLLALMSDRVKDSFDGGASRWSVEDADFALAAALCRALDLEFASDAPHSLTRWREEAWHCVRGMARFSRMQRHSFWFPKPVKHSASAASISSVTRRTRSNMTEGSLSPALRPNRSRKRRLGSARNSVPTLVVVGTQRYDLPRLPRKALREVIANAVAHRDYQLSGSSVEVHLTPTEVVVTSPGGFVAPVTSENLQDAHSARNNRVIHVLRTFGLAEDAGRGIGVILHEMAADLRLRPTFLEEPPGYVTVRLPVEGSVTPEERAWVRDLEARGDLLAEDRRVLVEAARGFELTNSGVRSLLDIDSVKARQSLGRLRDAGLLEQEGIKGGARYRLAATLHPPAGVPLTREERRARIVVLAADRPITNSTVRAETGLSRHEARSLLAELVASDALELRGRGRGAHYVLAEPPRREVSHPQLVDRE